MSESNELLTLRAENASLLERLADARRVNREMADKWQARDRENDRLREALEVLGGSDFTPAEYKRRARAALAKD